jgi:hypothetical protein
MGVGWPASLSAGWCQPFGVPGFFDLLPKLVLGDRVTFLDSLVSFLEDRPQRPQRAPGQ